MTLDLTGVATSVIAGVFSILAVVIPSMISAHMKDKQAAETLAAAVKNSLGAIQQEIEKDVSSTRLHVDIPGVPPSLAIGVQYVLDHAGDEAARFGITPPAIADKINAQIGLKVIAGNIALATTPERTINVINRTT